MDLTITKSEDQGKPGAIRRNMVLVGAVALCITPLMVVGRDLLTGPSTEMLVFSCFVFFGLLLLAVAHGRYRAQPVKWIAFILWWGLLVSEEVFSYRSDIESVQGANFASQAYDQAVLWLIVLLALVILLLKYPQSLRGLFQGDYKWVTWLTLFSALSCAYSPNPLFSLAWAFKLVMVVLVVHICAQQISGIQDLRSFLTVTIWAFVFLTLVPTFRSLFESDPTGEYGTGQLEQRFREAPTEISGIAGLLAILCIMLYWRGKPKWTLWVAAGALTIMVIAGGKAGIAAGFLSGILFFGMQKRFKAVLGFVAVTAIILALALKFTALSQYASTYLQLEQASSFTGRTDLWAFVMPFIMRHPIIGQGFIASRFVAVIHPDTPFSSSHMHNGYLETLYNNGLLGLGLMLMINFVIVRNLWRTVRDAASPEIRYLAIGGMAAFINLIINAMFNATFGGRPDASYLMLIAMVVISSQILRLSQISFPSGVPAAENNAGMRVPPIIAPGVSRNRLRPVN
jgi:exopolysaccharide production protein ExoQ